MREFPGMVLEESVAFQVAHKDNPLTVSVMNDVCRVFMHIIQLVFMGIQITYTVQLYY